MNAKRKIKKTLLINILLLAFLIQCIFSMISISSTSDEVAHLPAGYSYLKTGDFKLNPEHPLLIKIIAAYPLLFLNLPHPHTNRYFIENEKWEYGKSLIYQSGERAEKILFLGRLIIVLLGLFLAVLVYEWSKELFGKQAALFSLFLFSFEPNLIAHSRLITTDVGFALFFFLSIYWMWKYFQKPSFKSLILCGLSFGLAFATKFSAVLLCPIIMILIGMEFFLSFKKAGISHRGEILNSGDNDQSIKHRWASKPLIFFIITVPSLTALIVAASYGFLNIRYYFIGLKSVFIHSKMGHATFLAGQYSDTGWWYYFPLAFLLKTPIPFLIFFLAFLFLLFYTLIFSERKPRGNIAQENYLDHYEQKRANIRKWTYLTLPPLFFLGFSLMSRLNIGLRHILPIYPFIIVLCGMIFSNNLLQTLKWKKVIYLVLIFLCLWYIAESIFIFPNYLSYFNELIGGPSNGYKYFVDSNLDWGQNMPALKSFLENNRTEGVILSYFGNADPYYYGINYQYLPLCGKAKIPSNYHSPKKDFYYIAISATHLQAVFTFDHHCFDWLKNRKPYARIAYTIFLYDIRNDAEAHRKLAENYFESKMYAEAKKHLLRAQELSQKYE